MRCSRLLAPLFASLALLGAAPAAHDDGVALLRASFGAPERVSYVGQLEAVRFASQRATAVVMRVEHRAPASTRRWYLAPESVYGDYHITRGAATYDFDVKGRRLTISHDALLDDQIAANGDLARILRNYRVVTGGTETVAGRRAISLVLISRFTGERILRVWIDEQTHLVLEKVLFHGNGSIAAQTRFENVRYTADLPAALFDTTTPPGYTTYAGHDVAMPSRDVSRAIARAGFAPIEPRSLPQGFALVRADVETMQGLRSVHLVYSDGLRSLSLFENDRNSAPRFGALRPRIVRFEGHDAEQVEDGSTTLLSWREHRRAFVLVGDLLPREMISVAVSVIP